MLERSVSQCSGEKSRRSSNFRVELLLWQRQAAGSFGTVTVTHTGPLDEAPGPEAWRSSSWTWTRMSQRAR